VESWIRSWQVLRRSWIRHKIDCRIQEDTTSCGFDLKLFTPVVQIRDDLQYAHLEHSHTTSSFTVIVGRQREKPRSLSSTASLGRADLHSPLHCLTMKRGQGAEALLTMTILSLISSREIP
jgi:hypothetical protein